MGLLDSVLGQVMAGAGQSQRGPGEGLPDLGALGGLLGGLGGAGGAGGAGGGLSDLGALSGVLGGLLADNGGQGGLGGLVERFQQAGKGDVIGSWIGGGENAPISAPELGHVLGGDVLSGLSQKLGINVQTLLPMLAAVLPLLIDKLTPQGRAPAQGLGNQDDLMAALGRMLPKG